MENENYEIIVENLSKIYGNKKKNEAEIVALKDASFKIKKGELVVILGPSGAGKSTLLNILGGMDRATRGTFLLNNKDVTKMNEKELAEYRRYDVGFVFQFYNLMPSLSAYENVYLASSLVDKHFDPHEILSLCGLAGREKNFPAQLSGGEQQRVAIARALVKNPTLLLCDEPTGALDSKTGAQIMELLYRVCKEQNKTVIIVTHNKAISIIADRIIRVSDGEIVSNEEIANPKQASEIEF
ncbi:MAG: ABC transporter ATP-binding protein [Candidatus Onthovivens sp.]|nr:ABC transporter ATP-binding protein [Mollicutes bacterium]MDD6469056.1 ABC transporter ATP-binding protein [Bacilli bacterium]MDY2724917.1 ABC transporter ATP-binding protein [Candidatus Onthovivens sp.]MCI7225067.1 ABC transporter ATP-binding protein [Mollicutes bacterium]MCI7268533.1 ABC transporter ATP-binding protein [Mollicutes bacterium]